MKKFIAVAVTALLLGDNPAVVLAVENATVKSVRVSADSVYIDTDRPVEYKAFTTEQPPRLVLELMDSKLKTLQDIPVGSGPMRKVRTGQFQTSPVSISRVVVDLSQKSAYEITRKGAELVVMFQTRAARAAAPAVKDAPASAPAAAPAAPAQKVKVISPEPAEKPIEMTVEAAPIKPSEVSRTSSPAPVAITPKRSYASSSARSIMDSLPREPISFDYSDADVREVIDMLAAKAGLNIIYSDDVSGTVTIALSKVPFDEAFKTLLNVRGLAAQQVGDNILRIASPTTLLAEQKKALPQTRVFFLNYAKAADVKAQVEAVAGAEGRTARTITDESNNALIVTDTQLGLDSLARIIRSLDRAPKQVMIEVKLVEVNLNNGFDLGVDWSFNNAAAGLSGKVNMAGPVPGGQTFAGALTFGKVLGNTTVNAIIAAAVSQSKAKVLSDPKVATLNNKEANINITDQTPYNQQTSIVNTAGTTTTDNWQNVITGITLKVTPTINSDDRIAMHLIPSVIQLTGTPVGTAPPATATRGADTNVIVRDGETIVIGGLIQDTVSDKVFKVPLLGDIPFIGVLFRKKSATRVRKELLIFVTPKLVES